MVNKDKPDPARPALDTRYARGLQVGSSNIQNNTYHQYGPVVRSAYLEHVRSLAPIELKDREQELRHLAEFCTGAKRRPYVWWQADAGVGKSSLMSWFVLNPPPGVRVVSFFVTTRHARQSDRAGLIDVVLEQLAELLGESMPAHLTGATREAHLLDLLKRAAHACLRQGQRLVLVVDGLDQDSGVREGSQSYSIAALLPARPEAGMRIVVAGRRAELPADVPTGHPLRDRGVVRILDQPAFMVKQAELEALIATKAEERRQRSEEQRHRAEQELLEQAERELARLKQEWAAAEAERLRPFARIRAMAIAVTITGGWTLALVVVAWLSWGLYDAGLAVVLTRQAIAAGALVATGLALNAARLGAGYRPALKARTTWVPRRRVARTVGAIVGGVLLASGATAHDYLVSLDERLVRPDHGSLPSFGELVTIVFLVMATVGYVLAGLTAGVDLLSPWREQQRAREAAYRAALGGAVRATATEGWDAAARNTRSPNAAVRTRAYQEAIRLLGDYARSAEREGRNRRR